MHSRHHQQFKTKLILGFLLVSAAILLISYVSFMKKPAHEWYIWTGGAIILVNSGLYFIVSAVVHKVKSDFSKRKKKDEKLEESD